MTDKFNTNWDDVPDTDKNAIPIGWREVKDVRAVKIIGSIRDAAVDGYFELAPGATDKKPYADHFRIEVKCLWYERKPKTTWMHITIAGECKIIEHYTGQVISNIGGNRFR